MTEVLVQSHTDRTKFYEVLVKDRLDPESVICCCDGYSFRNRCSHQIDALAQVCGWVEGEESQTDEERDKMLCPRCGDYTETVEVD